MAKKNWLESTISLMKDAENIEVIAKDFQEQAKSDLTAEITSLDAELIRKKQTEKKAQAEYEKSAFTVFPENNTNSYIHNRDAAYSKLQSAQYDVKEVEKTLVRRREQLKELE